MKQTPSLVLSVTLAALSVFPNLAFSREIVIDEAEYSNVYNYCVKSLDLKHEDADSVATQIATAEGATDVRSSFIVIADLMLNQRTWFVNERLAEVAKQAALTPSRDYYVAAYSWALSDMRYNTSSATFKNPLIKDLYIQAIGLSFQPGQVSEDLPKTFDKLNDYTPGMSDEEKFALALHLVESSQSGLFFESLYNARNLGALEANPETSLHAALLAVGFQKN